MGILQEWVINTAGLLILFIINSLILVETSELRWSLIGQIIYFSLVMCILIQTKIGF